MDSMLPFIGMGVGVVALAGVALSARMRKVVTAPASPAAPASAHEPALRPKGAAPVATPAKVRRDAPPVARSQAVLDGLMPIVISILVLLSALYVVLSGTAYTDAEQKWAFGAIGTLLGYWLKK